MKRFLFVSFLLIFISLPVIGQVRTGNIYGTVVDATSGQPLPGVTVLLTGYKIAPMTAITTKEGHFRFLSLPPDSYTIKASLEGFKALVRKNIIVRVGSNVNLTLKLEQGTINEEITVTAAAPLVDVRKATVATNVTKDALQELPTARDPWVILELAPGVALDRENVGGNESGQQSNFVSRGVGRSGTNWNMDGVNVTDQISVGATPFYFDFDAFEEMQIQTAANDITSFTAGVQVNFVTKRGGNRFSGGGRIYYTSKSLEAENTPPEMTEEELQGNKVDHIGEYGLNFGGPLIKNKMWFWIGGSYQDINKILVTGNVQNQKMYNLDSKINLSLGKHRIEAFYNWSDKVVKGRESYGPLDAWESRYNQTSPHPFVKIEDEFTPTENLFVSAKVSYLPGGFKLEPIGPVGGIAIYDKAKDRYLGTYRMSDYIRPQYFGQITGNYFAENLFGADHEIKFGIEYKYSIGQRHRVYYSQRLYYTDYEAGITKYAYIYRNSDYKYYLYRFGAYVQDTISYKKLTLNLGLRFDTQSGGTHAISVEGTNVDWAGSYNLPAVSVPAKKLNFVWNTFSPRISVIYDLSGKGTTLLKAHFGIYGTHISSNFPYYLASTYGYVRWKWNDLNHDGAVQPNEISSPLVRDYYAVKDPEDLYDPNLSSPLTMEFTAGIEKQLFEDFAAGVNFIYRKNYNDYWTLYYVDDNGNIRLPQPDDWAIGGYIPQEYGGYAWWEYKPGIEVTTIPWSTQRSDFYTRYIALEFSFHKRLSTTSPFMLNGSFTFQDWRRFYPTRASYNDPTNHEPTELLDNHYAGYISTSSGGTNASINPRWMAKLGFLYRFPYNFNLSAVMVARDGYILPKHYTDYDVERNGIGDQPTVYIAPYGTYRLPTFLLVNLRLEKLVVFKGINTYFSADIFNLFNSNTALMEGYEVNSKIYEKTLQILNPRIVRLGMRFEF